jgi:hypothetical protein
MQIQLSFQFPHLLPEFLGALLQIDAALNLGGQLHGSNSIHVPLFNKFPNTANISSSQREAFWALNSLTKNGCQGS